MFITPIVKIDSLADLGKVESPKRSAEIPFQSYLNNALSNVKEADAAVKDAAYQVAMGESDDLHSITIASTKLTLATDLMIQLRNKALDAYNEIMRTGV